MEYIAICTVVYSILIFADIVPIIKKGQWKPLWFSISIYIITFILNVFLGLGAKISSGDIMEQLITNLSKLK